jgi:hypothetical protein
MKIVHRTMRGIPIDIDTLRTQNAKEPALGNARMNARGDIIGRGGEVVHSREQIAEEYHRSNARSVRHVNLREREQMLAIPDAPLVADGSRVYAADPNFFRNQQQNAPDIEFKTPEQIFAETRAAQLARQAELVEQFAQQNKIARDPLTSDIEDEFDEQETVRKPARTRKIVEKD